MPFSSSSSAASHHKDNKNQPCDTATYLYIVLSLPAFLPSFFPLPTKIWKFFCLPHPHPPSILNFFSSILFN
eukprot:m.72875 g.72875  ORF g.72875 m.72875 type:complete len:72 (-) comp13872_c2_seq1:100-315(-)